MSEKKKREPFKFTDELYAQEKETFVTWRGAIIDGTVMLGIKQVQSDRKLADVEPGTEEEPYFFMRCYRRKGNDLYEFFVLFNDNGYFFATADEAGVFRASSQSYLAKTGEVELTLEDKSLMASTVAAWAAADMNDGGDRQQ